MPGSLAGRRSDSSNESNQNSMAEYGSARARRLRRLLPVFLLAARFFRLNVSEFGRIRKTDAATCRQRERTRRSRCLLRGGGHADDRWLFALRVRSRVTTDLSLARLGGDHSPDGGSCLDLYGHFFRVAGGIVGDALERIGMTTLAGEDGRWRRARHGCPSLEFVAIDRNIDDVVRDAQSARPGSLAATVTANVGSVSLRRGAAERRSPVRSYLSTR